MRDDIYNIIESVCDYPVIWAYENGKRPKTTFFLLDVRTVNAQWSGIVGDVADDGSRQIDANREASVYLTCFGKDSDKILDEVAMRLQTERVLDMLEAANADIVDFDTIQHAPKLFERDHEQQAVLGFRYRYTANTTETIDFIESVDLNIDTQP